MAIYPKLFFTFTLICIVLMTGCSKQVFSPENVITKALDTDEDLTYYGELSASFEGLEELDDVSMKEWRDGTMSRVEMNTPDGLIDVVTSDENVLIYEESEQKAYYSEDEALQELYMDPRKQLDMVLDAVKDTHDTQNIGEEDIAGRPAVHLKLTKRDGEKSLFGDQELWVDKEHWLVLKMISNSGNMRNEAYYESIDFNATHHSSVFDLDLPEDVEMTNLDELNEDMIDKEINLEEIPDKFGPDVLYFVDNDVFELDSINFTEMEVEGNYQELTFEYKEVGNPLFTFTVIKSTDDDTLETDGNLDEAIENDTIRGKEAAITDAINFRSISWSEGDYQYSIMLIDPDLTKKQMKKWANDMKTIN